MNNRELEAMRQETTQLALLHINKTLELYEAYIALRDMGMSLKVNSQEGENIATVWAKDNKNEFGALFIAELPLVRWNNILREL